MSNDMGTQVLKLSIRSLPSGFSTSGIGKCRDLRPGWTTTAFHAGSPRWDRIWCDLTNAGFQARHPSTQCEKFQQGFALAGVESPPPRHGILSLRQRRCISKPGVDRLAIYPGCADKTWPYSNGVTSFFGQHKSVNFKWMINNHVGETTFCRKSDVTGVVRLSQ